MSGRKTRHQKEAFENRILAKSHCRCWYCGAELSKRPKDYSIDHFTPRCDGGTNTLKNLVPSCVRCNNLKGSLSLDEFRFVFALFSLTEPGRLRFSRMQIRFLMDCGVRLPGSDPTFYFERMGLRF